MGGLQEVFLIRSQPHDIVRLMPDDDRIPAQRADLIQAIQHGMLFDGRKRSHHWDRINAQIAAEKLADYLEKAGFEIRRKPPLPAHTMDTSWKKPEK